MVSRFETKKMEPQIRFCNTSDGIRIAYATVGEGPPLVYPPPWISNLELLWDWPAARAFFERLASHNTLVLYDKHGCGLSDRHRTDCSLDADLRDLETVVGHLELKQFALFSMSQGGPTSIAYAAKYPERVSHLILYGTYGRGDDIATDEIKESFISMVRAHWGIGSKTLSDIFIPHGDVADVEWWAKYQRESATSEMAVNFLNQVYNMDVTDLLNKVNAPTVVIHRKKDRAMQLKLGRELAASIPNAHFVSLEGGIHLPWLGDSDSVLRAIREFLGDPITTESGRLLVTVMFTDIVGSTEKAAELGDKSWRDLLESHHTLVRGELERFQGREVDTAGDGFLTTFDKPNQAIQCARAISDAVQGLGIEIRAGLHMGECEVTGEAVRGIAVHIGARVAAKAEPGEVLVSSTVKDMVAGSDIRFEDRGTHALKGIPDEWRLFAVERRSIS